MKALIAAMFAVALLSLSAIAYSQPAGASIVPPKNWVYNGSCHARGGLTADFFWKRGDSPRWHQVEVESYPSGNWSPNAYWHDKATKWIAPPDYHIFHFRNHLLGGHWVHSRWANWYTASRDWLRRCSKWEW